MFMPMFWGERPRRLQDQNFAQPLTPQDVLTMAPPQLSRDYYRPWKPMSNILRDSGSTIRTEKDRFLINLDVQHFAPQEISVKTVDGYIVIECRHEEKEDEHGFVARQFRRRYDLPEEYDLEAVESRLSSDGVLLVTAPLVHPAADEKVVPITQTGPMRTHLDKVEQCHGESAAAPAAHAESAANSQ